MRLFHLISLLSSLLAFNIYYGNLVMHINGGLNPVFAIAIAVVLVGAGYLIHAKVVENDLKRLSWYDSHILQKIGSRHSMESTATSSYPLMEA